MRCVSGYARNISKCYIYVCQSDAIHTSQSQSQGQVSTYHSGTHRRGERRPHGGEDKKGNERLLEDHHGALGVLGGEDARSDHQAMFESAGSAGRKDCGTYARHAKRDDDFFGCLTRSIQ